MSDCLVRVEGVGKKFCRRLRLSLWYGLVDLGGEVVGRNPRRDRLREGEFWAVKDVSLELRKGETIGLIGPNGAGKTTLLRMINGLIKPDSGRIEVRGRMQALIALGAGFNPVLTGRENLFVNASVLGIPQAEARRRFDEIVDFSGIGEFIDAPVQSYSSGMAVRLGFAVSAHLNPDILLVDEVLAVGDEGFQMKCLNKIGELRRNGTGIILVSHNMHTIMTNSNAAILMQGGRHSFHQNVSEGIGEYRNIFHKRDGYQLEKICSGNDRISFTQVAFPEQPMEPGGSFPIVMEYESECDIEDAEVDVAIYSSREPFLHFQATNRAYRRRIDLRKGRNRLEVTVDNIRIHDAKARIGVTIWEKDRTAMLFWWRFPAEFRRVDHATGNSFLGLTFREGAIGTGQSGCIRE